jgi:hypothetical protein
VDPSQHITSLSCGSEPSSPIENANITATFTSKIASVPTKTSVPNKIIRKSPRTTKKPTPPPQDKPLSIIKNSIVTTPQQESRKRLNSSDLISPPKKGPGVKNEIEVPPNTPLTSSLVFNLGYIEKAPARAFFKAARKGKNKMVSDVLAYDLVSVSKGASLSLPNNYEDFSLELQGAC